MISPLERAFCYSILEEGNKIEKDVKEKRPYVTLLTNIGMPAGMLLMGDFLYVIYKDFEGIIVRDIIEADILAAPLTFPFATIPAHIYVHTPAGNVILLFSGKLILVSIMAVMGLEAYARAWSCFDQTDCEHEDSSFLALGTTLAYIGLWGIYIYEIIDTYRAAVKYNEKLEKEKQNSQSSFFIQPIITPKGDIFLTGGIRF
jgi:hypothetical protein